MSSSGLTIRDLAIETPESIAEQYVPNPKLLGAVQVALDLGMPLLLTGEPGTGKTQLAYYLALNLHRQRPSLFASATPEVFHTKSTSVHTDLFYQYDALRHFRDSRWENELDKPVEDYITYEALGRAIQSAAAGHRTVVLVDEVDKALRDLPNDILNEIEHMRFTVKESRQEFSAKPSHKPVLLFTSNQERDLPDAFRRRCVFFHIRFEDLDLMKIVRSRLGAQVSSHEQLVQAALRHFLSIRKMALDKAPAAAELINWMRYLVQEGVEVDSQQAKTRQLLAASYSLLAKSDEDLKKLTPETNSPS